MFKINEKPLALTGYKMSTPHIMLGKNREANVFKGEIKLKEKVLDPYEFNDFMFCYSVAGKAEYA